jgi:protein-tyrosine phosphatase
MVKMKIPTAALLALFLWVSHSPIHVSAETVTPHLPRKQAVAGTTIVHFGKVDDGVYKGSRPRSDADYRFLQSLHIKYIVDLQFLPFLHFSEQKKAKKYGIALIPARINASPVSPSEKHVETILAVLADKRNHPVYFHCTLGRDRTSLIAALYKMYFLGMSQQNAWRYMNESGYKDGWVRSGLKRYLERHPTPPPALLRLSHEQRRTAKASPRDERPRSGLERKQAGSLRP